MRLCRTPGAWPRRALQPPGWCVQGCRPLALRTGACPGLVLGTDVPGPRRPCSPPCLWPLSPTKRLPHRRLLPGPYPRTVVGHSRHGSGAGRFWSRRSYGMPQQASLPFPGVTHDLAPEGALFLPTVLGSGDRLGLRLYVPRNLHHLLGLLPLCSLLSDEEHMLRDTSTTGMTTRRSKGVPSSQRLAGGWACDGGQGAELPPPGVAGEPVVAAVPLFFPSTCALQHM